jgi:hypothetical protein
MTHWVMKVEVTKVKGIGLCKGERGKEAVGFSTNKEKHMFIYPLRCLGFDGIILGKYNYYLFFIKI